MKENHFKSSRWQDQAPHDWFPVDEFTDVEIIKARGHSAKNLRSLVRLDSIRGNVDARGCATTSRHYMEDYIHIMELKAELERAYFNDPDGYDRVVVTLEYSLREIFKKPISIAQLKKALG